MANVETNLATVTAPPATGSAAALTIRHLSVSFGANQVHLDVVSLHTDRRPGEMRIRNMQKCCGT